jgi:hypothetical protein
MNLSEFNTFISTSQKWKLHVSNEKETWKLTCDNWSIYTNKIIVNISMEGIRKTGIVAVWHWYLIGDGYLTLKKNFIILNNFYTESKLENVTIPDLLIYYDNNLLFPEKTIL